MTNWNIAEKTVVVTGGNAGIGKATAIELARRGARVLITSRDAARGEQALAEIRDASGSSTVECVALDLGRLDAIAAAAEEIRRRAPELQVLINNAGVVLDSRRLTADGFEETFGVNHLGTFFLTTSLLDLLKANGPSRVITVASGMHLRALRGLDFDDLQSTRGYATLKAYAASKLANILFTRELARRTQGSGVTAYALHPGAVSTSFGRDGDTSGWMNLGIRLMQPFLISPPKGAATSVHLASAPDLAGHNGGYFGRSRPATPSRAARDDAAAKRLWEVSERLIAEARARAAA